MSKKAQLSESAIQQQIVQWYRNTYCLKHYNHRCMIFSIPNEGRGAESARLIQTGLYPGCADLCIIHRVSQYTVLPVLITLFVEVKTPDGKQSPKQKSFQEHCKNMRVGYYVVRSLEEAQRIIEAL